MSTSTQTHDTKSAADQKPAPPLKKPDVKPPDTPFACPDPPPTEDEKKEAALQAGYEAYRAKIAEDQGRSLPSFDQLSPEDRADFSGGGKLGAGEIGRAPNWIHTARNAHGQVVLVTRTQGALYVAGKNVAKDGPPNTGLESPAFSPITAGCATPYGNFTIVDGNWAYKGAVLYTSTLAVVTPDSGFTEALA